MQNESADKKKVTRYRLLIERVPSELRSASPAAWFRFQVEKARERISERLAPGDRLGVLRKVLLAESAPESPHGLLHALGFVHLTSASGIHLYALASMSGSLSLSLARTFGVPLGIALWVSRFLALFLFGSAWLLSGCRAGMLRPWFVVIARLGAVSLGVRWKVFAPLTLALALDLGVAVTHSLREIPGAWAPGRWHYALAVGGGLLAMQEAQRFKFRRAWLQTLWVHSALAVGSWLFTAVFEGFHTGLVALATPVLSLVTIPIFATFLYPVLILAAWAEPVVSVSQRFWNATGDSVSAVIEWLALLATQSRSLWGVSRPGLWAGFLSAVCIFIFHRSFFSRSNARSFQRQTQFTAAVICVLLFFRFALALVTEVQSTATPQPIRHVIEKANQIEQWDVGQGDSALVITAQSRLSSRSRAGMVDVGPRASLAPERWLSLLASRGIYSLDWIALTHLDEDHAGGLERLARLVSVGCVATSSAQIETARGLRLKNLTQLQGILLRSWVEPCFPFQAWDVSDGRIMRGRNPAPNSNMSAVRIELRNGMSYWNFGDASAQDELRLLKQWERQFSEGLNSGVSKNILKISHHGSRFSTTPEFLRRIRPVEAWISSGVGNSYGHPSQQVLGLIGDAGITLVRTDRDGMITTKVDRHRSPVHLR